MSRLLFIDWLKIHFDLWWIWYIIQIIINYVLFERKLYFHVFYISAIYLEIFLNYLNNSEFVLQFTFWYIDVSYLT